MAYVSTQLRLMVPSMNADSPQLWTLQGTDAVSTVRGANFVSDAQARGLRKGDIVLYTKWDNISTKATCQGHTLLTVLTVGSSGADLSDGTAVDATNT